MEAYYEELRRRAQLALAYLDLILEQKKGGANIVCAADHLRIGIARSENMRADARRDEMGEGDEL